MRLIRKLRAARRADTHVIIHVHRLPRQCASKLHMTDSILREQAFYNTAVPWWSVDIGKKWMLMEHLMEVGKSLRSPQQEFQSSHTKLSLSGARISSQFSSPFHPTCHTLPTLIN